MIGTSINTGSGLDTIVVSPTVVHIELCSPTARAEMTALVNRALNCNENPPAWLIALSDHLNFGHSLQPTVL